MTTVRLTPAGLAHYPRHRGRRAALGTVLATLPSGTVAVEFPWGIAFCHPAEVEAASSAP